MNKSYNSQKEENPFKLNDRMRRFVEEYLLTENATESYRRAYGQEDSNSAAVAGSKMLKKDKIQAEIKRRREQLANHIRVASPEELLIKLTLMMNDPELKPSEQLRAVELLGKNAGLFNDNQNQGNTTFQINLVSDENDNKQIQFVQMPNEQLEYKQDESEYVDYEEVE